MNMADSKLPRSELVTTKQEFIDSFLKFEFLPESIPDEWMFEAGELPEVREYLASDMARMVSKTGELYYTQPFQDLLSRSLSREATLYLYRTIRDSSHRMEREWRKQFETLFPLHADELPAELIDPYHDWYLAGQEFPVEWMPIAWADEKVRDAVVAGMARDIDAGDDRWAGPAWCELLDRSLTREQLVELYINVREKTTGPETAWRTTFELEFPFCSAYLPPMLDDDPTNGSRHNP